MFWHRAFYAFKWPRFLLSLILEANHVWESSFFLKYSKLYVDFGKQRKIEQKFLELEIISFEKVVLNIRFYWKRILFIWCQYVNKQSHAFRYCWKRIFQANSVSEWSRNMTKIRPCSLKQCFGPFKMLTVHKCSDTRLFRVLINPAFCSL